MNKTASQFDSEIQFAKPPRDELFVDHRGACASMMVQESVEFAPNVVARQLLHKVLHRWCLITDPWE
jgi:hypothetical protein